MMLESARLCDVHQALLVQQRQNARCAPALAALVEAPLRPLIAASFVALGARDERAQLAALGEAEALLSDGRLAFPREDGAYAEALLQWNAHGVRTLRAAAALAGAPAPLAEAFDAADAALQASAVPPCCCCCCCCSSCSDPPLHWRRRAEAPAGWGGQEALTALPLHAAARMVLDGAARGASLGPAQGSGAPPRAPLLCCPAARTSKLPWSHSRSRERARTRLLPA